jgi:hypothetical protein
VRPAIAAAGEGQAGEAAEALDGAHTIQMPHAVLGHGVPAAQTHEDRVSRDPERVAQVGARDVDGSPSL